MALPGADMVSAWKGGLGGLNPPEAAALGVPATLLPTAALPAAAAAPAAPTDDEDFGDFAEAAPKAGGFQAATPQPQGLGWAADVPALSAPANVTSSGGDYSGGGLPNGGPLPADLFSSSAMEDRGGAGHVHGSARGTVSSTLTAAQLSGAASVALAAAQPPVRVPEAESAAVSRSPPHSPEPRPLQSPHSSAPAITGGLPVDSPGKSPPLVPLGTAGDSFRAVSPVGEASAAPADEGSSDYGFGDDFGDFAQASPMPEIVIRRPLPLTAMPAPPRLAVQLPQLPQLAAPAPPPAAVLAAPPMAAPAPNERVLAEASGEEEEEEEDDEDSEFGDFAAACTSAAASPTASSAAPAPPVAPPVQLEVVFPDRCAHWLPSVPGLRILQRWNLSGQKCGAGPSPRNERDVNKQVG